jgi:hypothetical protein
VAAGKIVLAGIILELHTSFGPQQMVAQHGIERQPRYAESEQLEYPLIESDVLTDDSTPIEYLLQLPDHNDLLGDRHLAAHDRDAQDILAVPHVADAHAPQVVELSGTFHIYTDFIPYRPKVLYTLIHRGINNEVTIGPTDLWKQRLRYRAPEISIQDVSALVGPKNIRRVPRCYYLTTGEQRRFKDRAAPVINASDAAQSLQGFVA